MRDAAWLLAVSVLLAPALARADDGAPPPAPPVPGAIETTASTGYVQNLGATGSPAPSSASAGGLALGVTGGVRLDLRWTLGLALSYEQFDIEAREGAHALGAGAFVACHLAPAARLDPWVAGGVGYRRLTEPRGSASVGADVLDVARVLVGFDLRISQPLAIGPVLGFGASMVELDGAHVAIATFGALQGRFDFFGGYGD